METNDGEDVKIVEYCDVDECTCTDWAGVILGYACATDSQRIAGLKTQARYSDVRVELRKAQ